MTRIDDATVSVAGGSAPAAAGPDQAEGVRWLSEDQQRVWRSYLLGNALLSELLDTDLRRHGVDLAEYEILVVLSEAAEVHVRMSDLARAVHQSRSRLTHTITRMERAGLVRRTNCPTDRRGVWAELTEAGRDLLRRAAPGHVRAVRENFVEVISESDFAALGRAFAAVAERIAPRA
jgi:DNA-binding MarR family transcriptional regulator